MIEPAKGIFDLVGELEAGEKSHNQGIVSVTHTPGFPPADIVSQIRAGNNSILGVMIESNLEAGNQPIPADLSQLKYGCSVTDGCIDWNTTEKTLREAATLLRDVLPGRLAD